MAKNTFSTTYLNSVSQLNSECKWNNLCIKTPNATITPKDFVLLAIGTPNLIEEKWEIEIKDPRYNSRNDLVYALVIDGKILKFGKSITTMKKRVQSYHCGKDKYRIKKNATNSASNWYILQSVLHIGKPVYIYALFVPTTKGHFKGWTYCKRVSKEIEGLLLSAFETQYGSKPIGNRQS